MSVFVNMGFVNWHLCSTPQLLEGASQGLLHLPVVRLHQEVSLKSSYTGHATRLQCKGSLPHPALKREDRLGKDPFAGFGMVVEDIKRSGYTKNHRTSGRYFRPSEVRIRSILARFWLVFCLIL